MMYANKFPFSVGCIDYYADIETEVHTDNHADSDADGNRGHKETTMEDITITCLYNSDKKKVDMKKYKQKWIDRIQEAVDDKLELSDLEVPEQDYDRENDAGL